MHIERVSIFNEDKNIYEKINIPINKLTNSLCTKKSSVVVYELGIRDLLGNTISTHDIVLFTNKDFPNVRFIGLVLADVILSSDDLNNVNDIQVNSTYIAVIIDNARFKITDKITIISVLGTILGDPSEANISKFKGFVSVLYNKPIR